MRILVPPYCQHSLLYFTYFADILQYSWDVCLSILSLFFKILGILWVYILQYSWHIRWILSQYFSGIVGEILQYSYRICRFLSPVFLMIFGVLGVYSAVFLTYALNSEAVFLIISRVLWGIFCSIPSMYAGFLTRNSHDISDIGDSWRTCLVPTELRFGGCSSMVHSLAATS